jgi:hypothetical protein
MATVLPARAPAGAWTWPERGGPTGGCQRASTGVSWTDVYGSGIPVGWAGLVICHLLGVNLAKRQVIGLHSGGDGGQGRGHQEQEQRDQPYGRLYPVRPAA